MNNNLQRHFIKLQIIIMCMRRRKQKTNSSFKEEYTPEIEEEEKIKDQTTTKPKSRKKASDSKNKKSKSRDIDRSSNNEDSQQSQILEIRNGDEVTRDHIRPPFLKRWDGISNELKLTQEEMNDLSPMLRVYWQTKSKNMNAIVFLQFGRMEFFAFENDAIKLHEMTKKKLKRFSKFLMVNFWYKEIQEVKTQLFQMKIPVLVMNEIEDRQYKEEKGLIRRQVVEVITPALHLEQEDQTPRSRLLLSVFHKLGKCAAVILDAQSNHFFVEEFDDDLQYHEIRRIFNKYHPVELIIPNKEHKEIAQIARQICNPYINQCEIGLTSIEHQLNLFGAFNVSPLFPYLAQLYKEESQSQGNETFSKFRVVHALTLAWRYLSSLSLLQKVFYQGLFHNLNEKINTTSSFFDSQVYQNLQIFRIKSSQEETYAQPGTLMGFLDHCQTKHGRKLLHRWIDQPLSSIDHILQRQQAVKQLLQNSKLLDAHQQFMKYQRLEKRLGDIYHWVSRNYQKGKNILTRYINPEKEYDIKRNPAVTKLKELIEILRQVQKYEAFLKQLSKCSPRSTLLRKYIETAEVENIYNYSIEEINKIDCIPQIGFVAQSILRRIDYDELTGNLEPMTGESQVFDQQKKEVERIGEKLDDQLAKWKEYFKTEKITFVSVRAKNEMQVPKIAINKAKPNKELHFSSQIANFIRYTTHETNALSEEIMQHEKAIAQSYEPFLQDIVDQFCRYKFLWNIYVKSMSNLDVLMALAKAGQKMPTKCLPTFVRGGMTIINGYHPNLLAVKEDIIPNSIELRENEKVLLLTGPNMGGKSTFLKQVCSYAVLAQIGSFIPASSYSSIIYDQVFCRMGASDRIYEGKSTFYVQLEETKRILTKATSSSLVVIDELGRGTSTFDGMAIAQAILDCLMDKIGCMTIYSTHYTQITDKFKDNDAVKLMKMGYSCDSEGRVDFNYQLIEGVAEKSFAGNVGRMVGIPSEILKRAEIRSNKMHEEIKRKKMVRELFKKDQD